MSFFAIENPSPIDHKQGRLMQLAAVFLLLFSIILTLAPAAYLRSWEVNYRWNHWIGFVVWLLGTAFVHHQLVRALPERDPYLFPVASLLAGWGLLSIWRLDSVNGARQTIWLALCLLVFAGGLRYPHLLVALRRYKYVWLTSGLLLTGLTFLFGTYPGGIGPRLWLGCCGVYLQPSEPLKLLLIIYLAAYLADRLPVSFSLAQILTPTLILIGLALALLIFQRDLGTASLFILIYTVVVYIASQRSRLLVIGFLILLSAGVTGYLLFDVVRIRVDAWINPWLDPAGRSYQIVQSLLAVASGGFLGSGPGIGSPGVVPVAHSDFIFSSIAEETGMLGATGLLLLFGLLVIRGLRAALCASNQYRRYLAAGISAYLGMQAIFIIGGNLRLLPLTGVTLPFVSYGGSSLLTAFISLLLLVLISNQGEEEPASLPRSTPYIVVGGGLLAGLAALALVTGWWAIVRSDSLISRTDNPRRGIAELYVPRGRLLDRNNQVITETTGEPGSFQRLYEHPPLSATTGYNSQAYGQAGLEAGLDPYLRGLRGNTQTDIWRDHLIYRQPPPGLDVRLTLDLRLQKQADALLEGHRGALVLINASTGEILTMSSHPYFNPNRLEATWNTLITDSDAPLLNRATQGLYPPGAALSPFLFSYARATETLPDIPGELTYTTQAGTWTCASSPSPPLTPAKMVANGCPAPLVAFSRALGSDGLYEVLDSLGFYTAPDLPLVTATQEYQEIVEPVRAALGQEDLSVTPLQMALAAAALTNQGILPAPQLAAAVLTPTGGWTILPGNPAQETLLAGGAAAVVKALAVKDAPLWQVVAQPRTGEDGLVWYLAGTLPERQGSPLALALVLEEDDPALAEQIGRDFLNLALQ